MSPISSMKFLAKKPHVLFRPSSLALSLSISMILGLKAAGRCTPSPVPDCALPLSMPDTPGPVCTCVCRVYHSPEHFEAPSAAQQCARSLGCRHQTNGS
eukprot:1162044-Pelagomonas_calceolata.AAC.2